MEILIVGLTLFFAVHMLPSLLDLRAPLVAKMGEKAYKGGFALFSLIGMVLIIIGLMQADFVELYQPPAWGRHVTMLLVLIALIVYAAFKLPSNLRRITPHPMLWGITLWATGHLFANGDLASVLLFSSFLGYAQITIFLAWRNGVRPSTVILPWWRDGLMVVIAVVLYGLLIRFHESFTGMPLIGS